MSAALAARFCRTCHEYNEMAQKAEKAGYQFNVSFEDKRFHLDEMRTYYELRDIATFKALIAAQRQKEVFEIPLKPKGDAIAAMDRAMSACEFCKHDKAHLAYSIAEARELLKKK